LHVGWYTHGQIVDYGVYRHYGVAMKDHAVPYRDFDVEYPPAALPVFLAPALLPIDDYRRAFQLVMFLCDVVLVLAVLRLAGLRAAALAAVAPLLLGSVVLSRFDLYPAALTAVALLALVRRRFALGGIVLGCAFAAKLWPAVLAPFLLVWVWRTAGPHRALVAAGSAVATAAAWFLPFAAIAPDGLGHMFHAQLARPLQIESLGASLLIAVHNVFDTSLHVVGSFGSQNLAGTGVGVVQALTTALQVAALIAVFAVFVRGEPTVERLLLSCAAAVTVLIGFGKVFSPQFLIWLIPLVPLVRDRLAQVLLAASLVLTQVYFPGRYWSIATSFDATWSSVLLARNALAVGLAVALVYAISSSSRVSSSVSMRSGARTSP
jgi:uncharacterized membrane protein